MATLELLICLCIILSSGIQAVVASSSSSSLSSSSGDKWDDEIILGAIGAGICWCISLVLYIRKWLKRRRRARQPMEEHDSRSTEKETSNLYGSIGDAQDSSSSSEEEDKDNDDKVSSKPSPWTVISFTTLGALDEISYFPSLILGKIFTPLDLMLGTLFASIMVLIVVVFFLSRCKPILDWLDRIPLYGIVAAFALVLTVGVIVDVVQ